MQTATVRVTGVAVGGDGLARGPDGRVVLVAGGLPGELVRADVVAERRNHARALAVDVLEAAPERVAPPCPLVAAGCGGCGWQHVDPAAQRRLKVAMVVDALRRLGGVDDPSVEAGPELAPAGYRTTLRGVAGADGRFALRRRRSHEPVAVPGCLVAHPLVAEVVAAGRFPAGAEVTIRAGARTGERLVIVDPPPHRANGEPAAAAGPEAPGGGPRSRRRHGRAGAADPSAADAAGPSSSRAGGLPMAAELGAEVVVPGGVRVVGGDELAAGRRAWFHEEVAGRRFRISARSFFQPRPDGGEALVAAVAAVVGEPGPGAPHLVDLYGGVGLFAATAGRGGWRVTLVEASASAAADARVNLADPDPEAAGSDRGAGARVVRADVARWRPRPADVVVADPPRAGLGRAGVRAVAGTGAARLALVSCDAGALGRDAALLAAAGYRFAGATLVDQFVGTPHVEVVSRFERT